MDMMNITETICLQLMVTQLLTAGKKWLGQFNLLQGKWNYDKFDKE